MIKEERLNKRKVAKRVAFNHERLSCSRKTMHDIFRITFFHPEFTFFNVVKNGEVKNITYGEVKKQIEAIQAETKKQIEAARDDGKKQAEAEAAAAAEAAKAEAEQPGEEAPAEAPTEA